MNRFFIFTFLFYLPFSNIQANEFTVDSPNIKFDGKILNQQVFDGFGCNGDNISPELNWKGIPKGTKSLAVTVYDPDAPTGSGWWHWVVFNISPQVTSLKQGAGQPGNGLIPKNAVQSLTDFGKPGYGGPCPPVGDKPHRYEFTVHALKVEQLPLNEKSMPAMVGYYLNQNLIEKTVLRAEYGR